MKKFLLFSALFGSFVVNSMEKPKPRSAKRLFTEQISPEERRKMQEWMTVTSSRQARTFEERYTKLDGDKK